MSIWMFWKLFGDACLYFSVIGALPALFSHDFSFLLPALLCGIAGVTASFLTDKGYDRFTWLCVLLPAASFLLADDQIEYVMLIPPMVYAAIVILRGDYSLDYMTFREFFRKSILIWSIGFGLLCIGSAVEEISSPLRLTTSYTETLRMGVFYILSGIILQRQLRLGVDISDGEKKINGIQSMVVLGGTGAVIFGVWALESAYGDQLQNLMNRLGEMLMYLLSLPLALIVWIVSPLFEDIQEYYEETSIATGDTETTAEHIATFLEGEATVAPQPQIQQSGYPWWFVILMVSLLLILLLMFLNHYGRRRKGIVSSTTFAEIAEPEGKRHAAKTGNRGKIRRYYREHLKQEKRKGMQLKTNQTSADILKGISPTTDSAAAAALRQVYLKARYQECESVTSQDVETARNAAKRLRK